MVVDQNGDLLSAWQLELSFSHGEHRFAVRSLVFPRTQSPGASLVGLIFWASASAGALFPVRGGNGATFATRHLC